MFVKVTCQSHCNAQLQPLLFPDPVYSYGLQGAAERVKIAFWQQMGGAWTECYAVNPTLRNSYCKIAAIQWHNHYYLIASNRKALKHPMYLLDDGAIAVETLRQHYWAVIKIRPLLIAHD